MPNLILVRHGKTTFNIEGRFAGMSDIDIAEEGRQNAHFVAQQIADKNITLTRAYTSWLKRAWQTWQILEQDLALQIPITRHPFLNERHYGDLQGLLHSEMIAQYGEEQVHSWRRSYAVRPPNGENLADVVYRVSYYFETEILPQLQAGETILICAHGNSIRALVKKLENISDTDIIQREIPFDTPLYYTV